MIQEGVAGQSWSTIVFYINHKSSTKPQFVETLLSVKQYWWEIIKSILAWILSYLYLIILYSFTPVLHYTELPISVCSLKTWGSWVRGKGLYYSWHSKQHRCHHTIVNFPWPQILWVGNIDGPRWPQMDVCKRNGLCCRRGTLRVGNLVFFNGQ